MKKKALLSCALILGMIAAPTPSFAYREFWDGDMFCIESTTVNGVMNYDLAMPITIHVDGEYLPSDVDPTMQNSRVLVPLRAAGEAVGATVNWDQNSLTATATKGDRTVQFLLYNTTYYVNGQARTSDVAPTMIQNRTLLPLRAFAEAFDTSVKWDQNLYDVSIDTPAADAPAPNVPADVSQKTATFIKKYYVHSDASEPFVGSWRSIYTDPVGDAFSDFRPVTYDNYRFIINDKDHIYSCIEVNIQKYAKYNSEWFNIIKDDAMTYYGPNQDTMIHYINHDMNKLLYYVGPPRGGISGTAFYQVRGNGLYCTEYYDAFGNRTPDEYNYGLNHPFARF